MGKIGVGWVSSTRNASARVLHLRGWSFNSRKILPRVCARAHPTASFLGGTGYEPTSPISNPQSPVPSHKSPIPKQMICQLCERNLERLTVHHLIPRQKTKRKKVDPSPTINICSACHKQIHGLFDNTHLARELNSLDKLKNEPQMQKFLAWVKKQDPHKRIQVRRPKAS